MTNDLRSLARGGILRAAINTGNRALVRTDGEDLCGVSPALAHRLAEEIGATLEPVFYNGAGKVFADARRDVWDIAFLAIDPQRAEVVSFTRPYIVIDATYAVRSDASFANIADADADGVSILVSRGSAYDMYLAKSLERAGMIYAPSPGESFDAFRAGTGDLVAGVRQSLEQAFGGDASYRILPGGFHKVEQAMVLPDLKDPGLFALDAFVARAVADGFVKLESASSAKG